MWPAYRRPDRQQTTEIVMSTQPAVDAEVATSADSEIEAEVSWTVGSRPPEVVLSFQGLNEPTQLLDALRAIGWDVPRMPPRPANAIEWTPDPVAGTDFTVLPWTVTEFRLGEGAWSSEESEVGTRTLDALRNHDAKIIGTSEQIAEHAASYAARATGPIQSAPVAAANAPAAAVPPAEPAPVPDQPIAAEQPVATEPEAQHTPAAGDEQASSDGLGFRTIILLGFSPADDPLPGAGNWIGVSGRKKTQIYWNEQSIVMDQPIPGHQSMGALVSNGARAWYAETAAPLPEVAPEGYRIVRLIVPDMSVGDAKLRRLNKVLGDGIESFQLRSLVGANESAVLVNAVIGAHAFEMLKSNLTLRMPNAIVRTAA